MSRRTAWIAVAIAAIAASAFSGPSSRVAWTVETIRLVRSGDAVRGQKLNGDCAACHGGRGIGETEDVPNVAGQNALYTFKQLQDYKAKLRPNPIMVEAVSALSDRDMADLAAFYAAQKPPARRAAPPAEAVARLVSIGDGGRLIPACDSCHGARGAGNPGFYGVPTLQNQNARDIQTQLAAFKAGDRGNDVYRVMRDVAKQLSEAEIAALAAYYAGKR